MTAPPEEADPGVDRILTVPNVITARPPGLRAGVRVAALRRAPTRSAAAILLAVLGATDWVDGFVARRWHQVSTVGKVLDPIADRILVGTAVISVIVAGAVPLWFGVAHRGPRGARVGARCCSWPPSGAERIDVLWVGKAGTFGLMFAYPTFLLAHGHAGWQHPIEIVAWVSAVPALIAGLDRGRRRTSRWRERCARVGRGRGEPDGRRGRVAGGAWRCR